FQTALRHEPSSEDPLVNSGAKKTLAVLPFRNLGGDSQNDFYALSLADSIIVEVAKVGSLTVMPSTALTRYEGKAIDPARLRSELGVDMVLIGNYLKAGDRFRVTAQLVDAIGG